MENHTSKVKQHRIQTDSEDQFEELIHSLEWEIDSHSKDYGEDYWIRIFSEGIFTGDVFFVQLKGTDNIQQYCLKGRKTLSYPIQVSKLQQWQRSVLPVILVLWDTTNRLGYWLHIQSFTIQMTEQNPKWLEDFSRKRKIHFSMEQTFRIGDTSGFATAIGKLLSELRDGKTIQTLLKQAKDSVFFDISQVLAHLQILNAGSVHIHIQQQQLAILEARILSNPEDTYAWVEKAQIYYFLHDMDKALLAIEEAWKLDSNDLTVAWNRACVLAEYAIAHGGKPKWMFHEAIRIFNSREDKASEASVNYNVGNSLAGLGEHQEAIDRFNKALASNPPSELAAQIWKNKGTSYFHLGNHTDEIECYQRAIELDAGRWEAYASWAATELYLGNFVEAHRLYLRALAVNPDFCSYAAQGYSLAFATWKLGLNEEAYTRVNQVLSIEPNYRDALVLKSYILMALWRADDKYMDDAINHYRFLLLDDPENILAKSELHLLLIAKGELEEAKQIIKDAVQSNDVPPQVLFDYAVFLEREGNLNEAISQLERAFETSQEHHIVHTLGRLKEKVGDYHNAIRFYQMALQDVHDPDSILSSIADCHYRLGEFRDCVVNVFELIQRDPTNPNWWNNLIYSLVQLGYGSLAYKMRDPLRKAERALPFTSSEVEKILNGIRVELNL